MGGGDAQPDPMPLAAQLTLGTDEPALGSREPALGPPPIYPGPDAGTDGGSVERVLEVVRRIVPPTLQGGPQ